jgi:hypothetical protein
VRHSGGLAPGPTLVEDLELDTRFDRDDGLSGAGRENEEVSTGLPGLERSPCAFDDAGHGVVLEFLRKKLIGGFDDF